LLICKWQRGDGYFFLLLYEKKGSNFFPVELEIINLAMEKSLVEKKEQFLLVLIFATFFGTNTC